MTNAFSQSFLVITIFVSLVWLLSIKLKDVSIVDQIWGLLFVVQAFFYLSLKDTFDLRSLLLSGLVIVWGLRLSLYIHIRNRGHGEDYRYQAMRERHGSRKFWWYSFFSVFLLQGILAWIIGLPLLVGVYGSDGSQLSLFGILGIILWGVGFIFEAGGDYQLAQYKSNPNNKGKLLTTGFWSMTRHPNYFGDALLWWGYFLIACEVNGGVYTIVGPFLMSMLIYFVSGVRLLEKDLASKKPGYEDYIRRTPSFFPNILLYKAYKKIEHP